MEVVDGLGKKFHQSKYSNVLGLFKVNSIASICHSVADPPLMEESTNIIGEGEPMKCSILQNVFRDLLIKSR